MKIDKKFLFILTGRIVQAVVAILMIRLMTALLPRQEIGNQYVINSVILWFSLVLINPFGMFINRHVHEWFKNNQFLTALKKINLYFLFIALISIPIVYFVKDVLLIAESQTTGSFIILVLGYVYFSTWFQTLSSFFNLFDKQKEFVVLNIFSQVFGMILAYSLVKVYGLETFYWLLGLLLGQIASLLLGFYFLNRNSYFGLQKPINKEQPLQLFTLETFKFCYPVAFATVFMWFQTQGYRLVVEKYLGAEVLASLGIGLGIAASLAGIVESLTTQYLYPKYYLAISNANQEMRKVAWEKIWRAAVAIYVPCAFAVVAVSSILIRLLTAPAFHLYGYLISAGAVLELFRQLTNIVYLISHSEKRTKANILPYFSGAALLAVGLIVIFKKFELNLNWIVGLLLAAYFITLLFNAIVAYRILLVKFYFLDLLRSIALALPVLIFFKFLENLSAVTIILSNVVGIYTLGIIYYQLKKIKMT